MIFEPLPIIFCGFHRLLLLSKTTGPSLFAPVSFRSNSGSLNEATLSSRGFSLSGLTGIQLFDFLADVEEFYNIFLDSGVDFKADVRGHLLDAPRRDPRIHSSDLRGQILGSEARCILDSWGSEARSYRI